MPAPRQPAPRALSPEVPVVSYPTPNLSDIIVVQDVDSRVPGYTPAQYGDLHPDQTLYPGLKLVYQSPVDQQLNHMWVRRVYANDRADQDAYNFAVKYSAGFENAPVYMRTYVLPRATYEPLATGSPDPENPSARLVDQELQRIDDASLDSLFVKVIRVFEVFPTDPDTGAPVATLTSHATDEDGVHITITKTRYPAADYVPASGGATVTPSAVTESAGITTEEIRTAEEVFDRKVLSTQRQDPVPEKFRVNYPHASSAITSAAELDGAGEPIPPTQPVLANNEFERSVQRDGKYKLRETVVAREGHVAGSGITDPYPVLMGQEYEPQTDLIVKFVEKIEAAHTSVGSSSTSVTPISEDLDVVRVIDVDSVRSDLDSASFSYPSRTTLDLPPVLRNIQISWDTSQQMGELTTDSSVSASGYYNYSSGERGKQTITKQAIPSYAIDMEEVWARNVPTTTHVFYLETPTEAMILEKVSQLHGGETVLSWPVFRPQSHIINAVGKTLDVSGEIYVSRGVSVGSNGSCSESTKSKESGVNEKTTRVSVRIPPCLHGYLYSGSEGESPVLMESTVEMEEGWPTPSWIPEEIAGPLNDLNTVTMSFTKSATTQPTAEYSLSPTSPSDIPRSGLYMLDARVTDYSYGYYRVMAEVLDAGIFGGTYSGPAATLVGPFSASCFVGSPFSYTINVAGTLPITRSVTGLPAWASFNSTTGVISGTPTSAATHTVTISASNAYGSSSSALTIVVKAVPVVPVITSSLTGSATAGSAYTYTITASNSPTVFRATNLPAGLVVDTSTGVISGTVAAVGTYSIQIRATNTAGSDTETLVLTVTA